MTCENILSVLALSAHDDGEKYLFVFSKGTEEAKQNPRR